MAVNGNNGDQNATTQNTTTTQQQAAPVQQQHRPVSGLGGINELLQRSGSYDSTDTRSADALRALTEANNTLIAAQRLTAEHQLVRFDRDTHRVGLSAILVIKTYRVAGAITSAVRTLLLNSEHIKLRPRVVQMGQQRIETPTRAQDVFNDAYWTRLREQVIKFVGSNDIRVIDAGPLVIPVDFDFKDENAVARLLVTSVNACDDVISRTAGEQPINIAAVKTANGRFTTRIDFGGAPVADIVGHPIRSDITIAMNSQQAGGQQTDDFYDADANVNSVSGFINLEYTPPQMTQQQQMFGQQQIQTQMFSPTFVITQVAQANWINAKTPELFALAISNAYRVTAGTSWIRSFMPEVGKRDLDLRDVGALGYMTQAGAKIETKSDSFTEQNFVELMAQLVRPSPAFAIDVNPVGENSQIENYLLDAAYPGKNQKAAIAYLVSSMDNLTAGAFSRHFDANNEMLVIPTNQEIHMGYYEDAEKERRDIRDLDVLAVLNLCQGNIQDFVEWYRTYVDMTVPQELRLQQRERMERQWLSKSMVITGRATRLLLNPKFVEALDTATREAGLQVDFENINTVMGAQRFVGNTMISNYSVNSNAQMGFANTGGQTYAGYSGVTSSGRQY